MDFAPETKIETTGGDQPPVVYNSKVAARKYILIRARVSYVMEDRIQACEKRSCLFFVKMDAQEGGKVDVLRIQPN